MDEGDEPSLTIGEFARRSRLSAKALRLYDRMGLLVPAEVDGANGYRRYRESQLAAARMVLALRRLDMPLARVAAVVAAPGQEQAALIAVFWVETENRVAGQRHLAQHLITRLTGQEGSPSMYQIAEREVAEQRLLTEQRHTTVGGLPTFIAEALERLHGAAQALGLETGRSIVIYHGEVTEDSDGPVEVGVPVRGDADLSGHACRVEPAHREAYTPISKAQVEYPQIMSAYDAVEKWTQDQGREVVGSPREVYVENFDNLGPDDHGCDIAFPVAALCVRLM